MRLLVHQVENFHRTCRFYEEGEDGKHCQKFDCRIYCADVEPEDYKCWEKRGKVTCLGFLQEDIDYICSVYDGSSEIIDALQERWPDRPRWQFSKVAQKFRLAKTKPPRWTREDQAFLVLNRHLLSPKQMGERLGRSETGVRLKLKRLGYRWVQGVNGFLTMRAVGRLFGVDGHAVEWWIESGWLEASRFPVGFGVHHAWKISHDAICAFIEEEQHWHLWDPARMKPGDLKQYAEEVRSGTGTFLTTGELGKLAFYSHSWIRALISQGIIRAKKHGPNWKISQEEAERFMRKRGLPTLEMAEKYS